MSSFSRTSSRAGKLDPAPAAPSSGARPQYSSAADWGPDFRIAMAFSQVFG